MESQLQKFYSHPWRWSLTPAQPLPHQQAVKMVTKVITHCCVHGSTGQQPSCDSLLAMAEEASPWCLFLIVPSPAIPRQTWGQTTVFLHTQSSPARARLKDFDEKMSFLVNFHFLWGVHMRTHQCGSGGRTGSVLLGSENTIMEHLLLTLL